MNLLNCIGKYLYKVCLSNQLSNLFSSHRTEQYRKDIFSNLESNYKDGLELKMKRWRFATPIDSKDFKDAKLAYEHPSETSLDDAKFDYTIDNNGIIEELIYKVKDILIDIKLI